MQLPMNRPARRSTAGALRQGVVLAVGASLLVGGCTDEAQKKPAGVSSQELCDGTLDAEARAALGRLSGADRFTELPGMNDAGESNAFSVSRAVDHLHDEPGLRSKCRVYPTDDDSDFPLVEIQFLAALQHPAPLTAAHGGMVPFRVGAYAAVGKNGADLYFACTTTGTGASASGDTPYVKAEMLSPSLGTRDPRDRMVILTSVARAVARAAGCAEEAGLPRTVAQG
ncbi:hypothetical protein [Streptomyces longwoodensis]|uniref:hypothetical protein n=1 Tax=Streptomyces longwoodensis TaxID=68231 RepID=UPI003827A76C